MPRSDDGGDLADHAPHPGAFAHQPPQVVDSLQMGARQIAVRKTRESSRKKRSGLMESEDNLKKLPVMKSGSR